MIEVEIIQNRGLVALCHISGDQDEFYGDLARLKEAVDPSDREFVKSVEPNYWRVRRAELYAQAIPEIGDAVRLYKMQRRLPGF